jgi:4'-phosphopantetheinyl transferase
LPVAIHHLPEGAVDAWTVRLEGSAERLGRLERLLADDERQRAGRFRFDVHRHRFIVGRGALRLLLGEYLGERPERLLFRYGPRGKPFLLEHPDLHFNFSNSADRGLLAVTRIAEIGADLEQRREMSDLLAIAERFFAAGEVRRLLDLPREQHEECFFRCWTRKEAYLKAVGEGLAIPLDRFEVTLAPEDEPKFLGFDDPEETPDAWTLHHLIPAPNFLGAIALRAPLREVRLREWEG